jgi:hypothetical protein
MKNQDIVNGLKQLGFDSGWVVSGDEITLWENPEPQPTMEAILEAAKDYLEPIPTIADKLASVGLSLDELKSAILGGN